MPQLPNALHAWKSDAFARTLKAEIEGLKTGVLPLDKGVAQGGRVDAGDLTATVLHVSDDATAIRAVVGVFFTEIIAGCSCGDDPMPINAYCELQVSIDKATAEADFEVLPDR